MKNFAIDCTYLIATSPGVANMCFISDRVESERGYIRLTRLNDLYREELIELRRRVSRPLSSVSLLSDCITFRC